MRGWWSALAVLAACGTDVPNTAQCDGNAQVLYSGHVWGANLAVADGLVYFTTFGGDTIESGQDPHSVMAVSTTCGAQPQTVWTAPSNQPFGSGMAVRGGRVIWAQSEGLATQVGIYSTSITGGSPTLLGTIDHPAYYASFAADAAAVYTADGANIMRIALDGSGTTTIGTPLPPGDQLDWIEMRDTSLYYATFAGSTYLLETLDTTSETVTAIAAPTDYGGGQFDVDDSGFYLPTPSGIELVGFDGAAHGHVTSGGMEWTSVIRGPDGFYGSDADGSMARMAFDGSTLDQLDTRGAVSPTLVSDGTSVYGAACCGTLYELPAGAQP